MLLAAGSGSGEASAGGGEQLSVPDFSLGSGSVSGFEGPVDGGSAAARGLAGAARLGAGTGRDLCGSGEVPEDLLPCGQLAVHWPDEGTQGEYIGGRQDSEGRLPVSADERLEAGAADRHPSIRTPFPQAAGDGPGSGGCVCPALAAAAARAEHAGGRAVRFPVGVLEGASGICDHAGRTVGAMPDDGDRTVAAGSGVAVLHLQCLGQAGENLFKTLHQAILKVVFDAETRPRHERKVHPDTDRRWQGHRVFAVDGTSLNLPRGLVREGWRTPVDGAHYP